MQKFRDVFDERGFANLGFMGNKFTWSKHNPDGYTVWERLDRAVGTCAWLIMFPASMVCHSECGTSYHKPIVVHLKGIPECKQKPWRFEQVWLSESGCHDVIKSAWPSTDRGCYMEDVMVKVDRCKNRLQHWSKASFRNITKALNDKRNALRKAKFEAQMGSSYESVFILKKGITKLLANEERLWQQRSKAHWITSGDKNTAFFHRKASQRFRRNQIDGLGNQIGEMCLGENNVANIIINYY